ncbi:LysE family translocator, partial [Prochlorothrix hollandica]|uniref:LysE family translocator n=1 Tax=Prochlorothrix hollandica TaxID=1223 RepID=UPI003340AB95
MVTTLGRGFVLGLAIAAPVGPIGVLCIRQTLAQGWWMGLATGLGAATADALYGCIAGLGLSALGGFLTDSQGLLHTVGGLFLCYLGVRTFQGSPTSNSSRSESSSSDSLSSDSLSSDSLSSDSLSS